MVLASPEDIEVLLEDGLRDADLRELEVNGQTPRFALEFSLKVSTRAYCILVDGRPAAIFGVADDIRFPGVSAGVVWLLGTPRLLTISRQFLRESRDYLNLLSRGYSVLGNVVHRENTVHIRWLEWLGFTILDSYGDQLEFARIC